MPRIAPDLFDQIVWPLTETSGPYSNVGALSPNSSTTDLTITNTVVRTGCGIFGDNCIQLPATSNFPSGSNATRNYAAGAKTVNLQPPITLSFWVYLRGYTTSNNMGLVSKEYRDSDITSSWTFPFNAINIACVTTNGGGDWAAVVTHDVGTRTLFTITDYPIPLGVWSHIGLTFDGSYLRAYLNGCQMIFYSGGTQFDKVTAAGSGLSYSDGSNGFGYWRIGAITATGSSSKEEPMANIQDVRIANVARSLNYFKTVYSAGFFPTTGGFVSAQYYKLRAYDLSCVTPTYVVWVDTQVSLANAPAFPCSGPYSAPEVIETWYI